MAGAVTRMLVLGVVTLFEPLNGYQIRRELLSWGVEEWSELKAGSIYSMLATLEKQGRVRRWDLAENGTRSVAVYATTDAGHDEFRRLVLGGLDGTLGTDTATFQSAMSFLPSLGRAEVLTALRTRQQRLGDQVAVLAERVGRGDDGFVPPHVRHLLRLDHDLRVREARWLDAFVETVAGGALSFRGEPGDGWQPPADDAGWEMVEQSRRYRAQIAALSS